MIYSLKVYTEECTKTTCQGQENQRGDVWVVLKNRKKATVESPKSAFKRKNRI